MYTNNLKSVFYDHESQRGKEARERERSDFLSRVVVLYQCESPMNTMNIVSALHSNGQCGGIILEVFGQNWYLLYYLSL
jgi:hypothetical protein